MKNTVDIANGILSKANDFKYFVLLGTFILFLDSSLIFYKNTALINLNISYLKDNISVGSILIFLCLFCLFVSFVVGTIRMMLSALIYMIPYEWSALFRLDSYSKIDYDNYISSSDLKTFAITNNNQVAYDAYLNWKSENTSKLLEHYSLSFLLASTLNLLAWFKSDDAILNILFSIDSNANLLSVDTFIMMLSSILYIALFYLGVIVGCGLTFDRLSHYIYLHNHGIKKN